MLATRKKYAWISGEVCEVSGRYFSDSCIHELEREFIASDIFPRCPMCNQLVRWGRLSDAIAQAEPVLFR